MRRVAFTVVAALALLASSVQAGGAPERVRAVGAIGMTVASVERSAAFYADVLGFEKVSDVEVAGEAGVEHVSPEPQRLPDWNPAAGGIRAFYFKDPDGHVLEVLWFPPGKGDVKWRRADALFLGIDHTAIVVADTARSLACYRDALGLAVAGASENWGL